MRSNKVRASDYHRLGFCLQNSGYIQVVRMALLILDRLFQRTRAISFQANYLR